MSSLIIWLILRLFFKTICMPHPRKQFLPLQVRTLLIQLKTLPCIKTNCRLVGNEVIFCGPLSRSKSFINRAELERKRQERITGTWQILYLKIRRKNSKILNDILLAFLVFLFYAFLGLHTRRIKFVQHSLRPISWT